MMKNRFYSLLFIFVIGIFIISGCGKNETLPSQTKSKAEITQTEVTNHNFIFTANEGGSFSKIDAESYKVLDTIKMDGTVHNVQVSPNGKILGVTVVPSMSHSGGHGHSMKMNGKAVFYDTQTNELLKEVEVGNHPAHIVFTENGKYALVTNNEDNTVSVIDLHDYSIIQTIETGNGPHGFRISKDSQYAYIANMGENTVSVINLEKFTEEKKIEVGLAPVTTALTNNGKLLVTTLNGENAISIVDLESGDRQKLKVGNGPAQVYIQPDNRFAFIANQGSENTPSHSVTKVDLESKKVVATIETGKGSHGVVTSPDNQFVYVTNMFDNTVSIIDNNQNKVIHTIPVDKIPNGISVTP